jgi:hypothetical protein
LLLLGTLLYKFNRCHATPTRSGYRRVTAAEMLFQSIFSRTSCFLNKPVTKDTFGVFGKTPSIF